MDQYYLFHFLTVGVVKTAIILPVIDMYGSHVGPSFYINYEA